MSAEIPLDSRVLMAGALLVVTVPTGTADSSTLEAIASTVQTAAAAVGMTPDQVLVLAGVSIDMLDDDQLRAAGLARLELLRDVVVAANRYSESNEGDDAYRQQRWRELFAAVERAEPVVYPL